MAKTKKVKPKPDANPRSRAAKRASSPSIDIDKSVKETPRATDDMSKLHARTNAGVTKAKKARKPLKRGQRVRQERGLERAEIVMDQLEKKVAGSQAKLKKRKERKAIWDEINDASNEEKRKTPKFAVLADEEEANGGWEDETEEDGDATMKVVDAVEVPASAAAHTLTVVDRTASAAGSDVDEIT